MEAITRSHVYTSLKSYWRRRKYRRIGTKNADKRIIRLGDGTERKRRKSPWKAMRMMKVLIRMPTPKGILAKLRDSYVMAMHSWAGTTPSTTVKRITEGKAKGAKRVHSHKEGEMSEFEKKMILHIYNTVMANPNCKEVMKITS